MVRYLQLAHNVWDPVAKRSRAQVIYNFGREDAANRAALRRLIASLTRFLESDAALAAGAGEGLAFIEYALRRVFPRSPSQEEAAAKNGSSPSSINHDTKLFVSADRQIVFGPEAEDLLRQNDDLKHLTEEEVVGDGN